MSLRFALLGLLAEEPSSGYDLSRRFEEGIGSFAWSASHSQIYPELIRLAAEGLVEAAAAGARGRKVYAITDAGHSDLRAWLLTPRSGGTVRNEFVLRLFLLSTLDPADATAVLAGVVAFAEAQIEALEPELAALADHPRGYGPAIAAKYGIFSYAAARDWAIWAADQVAAREEPAHKIAAN